jgi:uncharacterized protein YcbK (DUF882 family)
MKQALPSRRQFFRRAAQFAAAGAALPASAFASQPAVRSLAFEHTHTGERIDLVYASGGEYLAPALATLDRFLRDHYTGDVGRIDPQLFDLLHATQAQLRTRTPYQVICGYRCAKTNEMLRTTRGGGVAAHSLHMDGRAIDVRLPGVPLAELRDAALSLQGGGVGYYAREQFIHVDTGRVRRW